MGGGASSLPEETQAALSEETRAAIEGLSEEAKREIITIAGMMELAPAAVEASTPRATAPVVDENAALFVPAAGAVAEETEPAVDEKNAALVAQAAEKVAKEEPLKLLKKGDDYYGEPLQEDDEMWRKRDGTAFESALQVDPEHGVSPVKLIDMRFIIALGELGGTMVRRQDLPKEAFIDLDTLKRLPRGTLPIITISHPWQQPDHPDPKEVNLQLLAKVLKLMLEFFKKYTGCGTCAVFFE